MTGSADDGIDKILAVSGKLDGHDVREFPVEDLQPRVLCNVDIDIFY